MVQIQFNQLKKRLSRLEQQLERRQLARRPQHFTQFEEDALAIYSAMCYLDATTSPSYSDVEPTAVYARGEELRNAFYGPIIPAHQDEHLKRYTRASGEFELAFGREPKAGDILQYGHLELTHNSETYSRYFGRVVEAWQRNLCELTCPLRFEDGRLFRRLRPERRGVEPKWKEDFGTQPEDRWLSIPEVRSNTDFDRKLCVLAVVFLGVAGVKHRCRPATEEELQAEAELPTKEPTFFMFGQQKTNELLVEVFGA